MLDDTSHADFSLDCYRLWGWTSHSSSYMTFLPSQAPADIVGVDLNGSVFSYNFIYNDGSGSPPTFVVPSASCSDGVCQHVFHIPTSSVPPSYTVSVTATNVFGEGPATTSIPIRE